MIDMSNEGVLKHFQEAFALQNEVQFLEVDDKD